MSAKDKSISSKTGVSKDEMNKVKLALDALEKDPQAYDFLVPVDYVGNCLLI